MKFHPALAPFKAAVLPLAKKLAPVAEPVYEELAKYFSVYIVHFLSGELTVLSQVKVSSVCNPPKPEA